MWLLTLGLVLIGSITLLGALNQGIKCKHMTKQVVTSKGLCYYNFSIIGLFLVYLMVEYFTTMVEAYKLLLLAIIFVLEAWAWLLKYQLAERIPKSSN
ncbi:hypothetical protein [Periweissella ghanensis]|uniref:DUF3784 domain-containing protein n=1 Tax=Periweissella ghanensis TaxID=467997 RepID=A0ABM8ZC25_9LACO|nr:hypothetical protein [Periweissella ghanensis]MCM0600011.1 hypothetical protein [Periweissella ghanensis]CAH0418933.1 hypothetical protein WGH24286_01376 [Periweissella ghanensis]